MCRQFNVAFVVCGEGDEEDILPDESAMFDVRKITIDNNDCWTDTKTLGNSR